MSDPLAHLEPRSVWEQFSEILRIPRPSGHEAAVAGHLTAVAARHGFKTSSDGVGNLVIDVPASPGREKAPVIVLQGHLDMVAEKNKDVTHDFMKDPIRPRIVGEWVHATGTTLGADNGIGVASAVAAAVDPKVMHGPLQLLFTVDEETGLTGAMKLDGSMLRGKTLLNLDSEEDGVLFVGCAGGADTHLYFTPAWTSPARGASPFVVEVKGLRGGHSGLNIIENRGNALKILSRALAGAVIDGIGIGIASLEGGSKHNAIPREAEATVFLAPADEPRLRKVVDRLAADLKVEFQGIDDGLAISVRPGAPSARAMSADDSHRLLHLLLGLPHGNLGMSQAIPGLVETSSNLAVVSAEGDRLKVVCSSRSSVAPALDAVLLSIRAIGALADVEVVSRDGYPGWKPNMASPVLAVVRDVFGKLWGKEPSVTAIHAGLECGLLGDKVPGMDMISFGPHMEGVHSPDERLNIPSVGRFFNALAEILDRLSR
ncbi:MAG: aminoacyl-histidine dipeptidase [Acidobacteriia bacterium]|nr:aminoacyl-histidine dipeptidase [Terriglobia bacterium]